MGNRILPEVDACASFRDMSAIELEKAVEQLPPEQLAKFTSWFEEFIADQWDRRLESDISAGKLDAIARTAELAFESGQCRPQ